MVTNNAYAKLILRKNNKEHLGYEYNNGDNDRIRS
jgi:hypothetical protein